MGDRRHPAFTDSDLGFDELVYYLLTSSPPFFQYRIKAETVVELRCRTLDSLQSNPTQITPNQVNPIQRLSHSLFSPAHPCPGYMGRQEVSLAEHSCRSHHPLHTLLTTSKQASKQANGERPANQGRQAQVRRERERHRISSAPHDATQRNAVQWKRLNRHRHSCPSSARKLTACEGYNSGGWVLLDLRRVSYALCAVAGLSRGRTWACSLHAGWCMLPSTCCVLACFAVIG